MRDVADLFQQAELFISAAPYVSWQSSIIIPEIHVRAMEHGLTLKGLSSSGVVVGQGAIDTVVYAAGFEIDF